MSQNRGFYLFLLLCSSRETGSSTTQTLYLLSPHSNDQYKLKPANSDAIM